MSEAQNLFDKLEKMPMDKLLSLCSLAINEKMEKKRLDMLLLILETRLQKYRLCVRLGLKEDL